MSTKEPVMLFALHLIKARDSSSDLSYMCPLQKTRSHWEAMVVDRAPGEGQLKCCELCGWRPSTTAGPTQSRATGVTRWSEWANAGGRDGHLYRCSRREICITVSAPHPATAAAVPDTTRHGCGLQQGPRCQEEGTAQRATPGSTQGSCFSQPGLLLSHPRWSRPALAVGIFYLLTFPTKGSHACATPAPPPFTLQGSGCGATWQFPLLEKFSCKT